MASELPVVDLSKLTTPESLQQVACACQEWGFFQIINHGVDQQLLDQATTVCQDFFHLPMQEKLKVATGKPPLGFVHESQQGGVSEHRQHLLLLSAMECTWPQEPQTFRSTLQELLQQLAKLVERLLVKVFESLNLSDSGFLDKVHKGDLDSLLIHYYPPLINLKDRVPLSEHKDNSIMTLVYQQNKVHSLQVLKDRQWVTIKPLEGAFIVNIGDLVEVWSNGKFKSVKHRVVANETLERHSMAFFVMADTNMEISPLEQFTKDEAPRYRGFTLGDYIKMRNQNKKPGCKNIVTLEQYKIS